jgi:hypothetical protein
VTAFVGPVRKNLSLRTPRRPRPKELDYPSNTLPILALDPGGTTGWSLLVLRRNIDGRDVFSWDLNTILASKISWTHGEINCIDNEDEAVYHIAKVCSQHPNAAIVVEDFILRSNRKEKSRDLLSPVRITAKLEHCLWREGRRLFLQTAGQTKPIMTDERLGLLGVLARDGMPDHARDADRHAVMFIRRCLGPRGVALKCSAWPHIYPNGLVSAN